MKAADRLTFPFAPYLGIDVSGWQKRLDYDAAVADGVSFVWIKASEGASESGLSPTASQHCRGFSEAGAEIGTYHFATPHLGNPDFDPEREAERELRELDDLAATDLVPALDYEKRHAIMPATDWICRFLRRRSDALGIAGALYAGRLIRNGTIDLEVVREAFPDLVLWVPKYPAPDDSPIERFVRAFDEDTPGVPGWHVAQYSSSWRPAWSDSSIDVNVARSLDCIRWQA